MSDALTDRLTAIVGARHVSVDPDVLAGRCVDHTGRYRGKASALVRPGSADEVAAVLAACRDAGAYVTVQGGRTSLVAGTVPEHDDVLLSTERLSELGPIDVVERRVRVGAGATAAAVQKAAVDAGLVFGVDLASRDSATVGGMAATNAGGLRTVRYGNMGEQVLGLDVALPDGSVVQRHSDVRRDNTGYDLAALFIGAEGTLGVITALDLRLHPTPAHRVTAVAGFADLGALLEAARGLRDADSIAALELVDARASALTAEHLGVGAPVDGAWQLLIELAGDVDHTERLAEALEGAELAGEPAVGVDVAAQRRLWQVSESIAEILGIYGPPLKFDVSLPLGELVPFAAAADELVAGARPRRDPAAVRPRRRGQSALEPGAVHARRRTRAAAVRGDDGVDRQTPRQRQLRTRGRQPQTRLPRDVADRGRHRRHAGREDGLRPDGHLNPAVLFRREPERQSLNRIECRP